MVDVVSEKAVDAIVSCTAFNLCFSTAATRLGRSLLHLLAASNLKSFFQSCR